MSTKCQSFYSLYYPSSIRAGEVLFIINSASLNVNKMYVHKLLREIIL
jgi:hypothetical protein